TKGTPAYMSPEQAEGNTELVGPASDVYSLGAILYAILTGQPPVSGKDVPEVLGKVKRGAWVAPIRVRRDVPVELDAICRKAMHPDPEKRYGTALELAADVERWLADEPVSAYQGSWQARWQRLERRQATGWLVVMFLVCAALLGYWMAREDE